MGTQVAVVMPVYNAERFLRESMDSVLGQTYHDFIFLVCDDCSGDGNLRADAGRTAGLCRRRRVELESVGYRRSAGRRRNLRRSLRRVAVRIGDGRCRRTLEG